MRRLGSPIGATLSSTLVGRSLFHSSLSRGSAQRGIPMIAIPRVRSMFHTPVAGSVALGSTLTSAARPRYRKAFARISCELTTPNRRGEAATCRVRRRERACMPPCRGIGARQRAEPKGEGALWKRRLASLLSGWELLVGLLGDISGMVLVEGARLERSTSASLSWCSRQR